jgi:hypothetical protein
MDKALHSVGGFQTHDLKILEAVAIASQMYIVLRRQGFF